MTNVWYEIGIRLFGAVVCIALMWRFSYTHLLVPEKLNALRLLVILPFFLIAVNNFPFLSVLMGDASLASATADGYVKYALLCLAVGLFEELAFRGCVFVYALEQTKRISSAPLRVLAASVISSAVFGLVHLTNLFAGASIGAVLLQVCYSFLIGGMCSIMLLKTQNVWYCVLCHAIYNFAGGVVPELGSGTLWTVPTVVLTAVVGVAVAVYAFVVLFRISADEVERTVKGKRAVGVREE
jgi:membrane protease YdiL (CAAX protease family)